MTFTPIKHSDTQVNLAQFKAAGGFPNPCENNLVESVSLDSLIIKNKNSTFWFRVSGHSMAPAISDGAIIVVDRSITPASGQVVLATLDGDFVVKELHLNKDQAHFKSWNPDYPTKTIQIDIESSWEEGNIWGVVTSAIHIF